ncbi:MAG TPA: alpha-amylase family glycosyl hydrolase [Candidatus Acidoferrum sp.]|nr:alpha-amylase family glycosyl hydrolase [Candidatus Acidoferrum sp.]
MVLATAAVLLSPRVWGAVEPSATATNQGPQWLRSGVIYEIFPRDFSRAGNLDGVTARLNDLKKLGVTILWLMPIQPIGEKGRKGDFGSPYSIKDYYAIDPAYGTLEDFKRLVSEAHARGLKVIMDLVINHTAWDSVMMTNKGFYKQDAQGRVIPPMPEWTDVAGLNYNNPELRAYMLQMMKYWVQTCDIDGYRCDVAYGVPTDFWVQAGEELRKIKPDFMMLAEASKPELLVKAFDVDYDWPLMATLNKVLIDGAPATELAATWQASREQFPKDSLHMRVSDNHDEPRAVARFGINGALAASVLMFTLDGVPVLYNGMEVGDATESGDPALFDKLPIFWQPKGRPPLREIYRGLIELRKSNSCFWNNQVTWLTNSASADVVTFLRANDRDQFLVLINFSNRPMEATIQGNLPEGFQPVRVDGMPLPPKSGLPHFRLGGFEWRIYHRSLNASPAK